MLCQVGIVVPGLQCCACLVVLRQVHSVMPGW